MPLAILQDEFLLAENISFISAAHKEAIAAAMEWGTIAELQQQKTERQQNLYQ